MRQVSIKTRIESKKYNFYLPVDFLGMENFINFSESEFSDDFFSFSKDAKSSSSFLSFLWEWGTES